MTLFLRNSHYLTSPPYISLLVIFSRFVTRKGKVLCADPSMPWVIKAVKAIDRRTKTQINSKKATNTKKEAGKNKQRKQKNNQNKKKNVKKVPQAKSNKATPTAISSIVKS